MYNIFSQIYLRSHFNFLIIGSQLYINNRTSLNTIKGHLLIRKLKNGGKPVHSLAGDKSCLSESELPMVSSQWA